MTWHSMGVLKKGWRKILNDRMAYGRKNSKTLTKAAFSALFTQLHAALFPGGITRSNNLVSGFLKCGIHPFHPDKCLD
uniref:Uncharacterized protein n=1 Tax=Octopus bimaculoides TaxID=37653 RepID=A0A0L8HHX0_OCTBM